MAPLFQKHMDDIISGEFSSGMMADWANDDKNLLGWREETGKTAFETAAQFEGKIAEQDYFDQGVVMIAMVKAGVELAFETMVAAGIIEESAYYESLHELPLIANTIARKRLYEMNVVISDTAEYGNYLFSNAATLLKEVMTTLQAGDWVIRCCDLLITRSCVTLRTIRPPIASLCTCWLMTDMTFAVAADILQSFELQMRWFL